MYLDEIVNGPKLETKEYEIIQRLNREKIEGWLKTVAGFANANGGTILIGVEDKTNKLVGFERRDADNERNFFKSKVNEHIYPRPNISIDFIGYENNGRSLFIISIKIAESAYKPVVLKYRNVPSIYIRREGFTNGATYEEIIDMSVKSKKAQYDILDSDVFYNRSDFTDLLEFYSQHNNNEILTDKALASMGFFNKDKVLKNGALLFADGYMDNKTEVMCSVFSGFNKGSDRLVTVNRFRGNIIDSIAFMVEFVKQRMNHTIIKEADGRRNIAAYPERALFEGVINSIAHRDYYLDGTQIQLDMFKDRLEITSPGSFYEGAFISKTYDLSNVISKRRNELICNVLVKCNVMEAAGTGFDKIMQEYKAADHNHKPFVCSTSDHFTLVLPDLTFEEGVIGSDIYANVVYGPVEEGTKYDQKVLAYCYDSAKKISDIASYLGLSDSSYLRDKILGNLERQGYLLKSLRGRTSYFRSNHEQVELA